MRLDAPVEKKFLPTGLPQLDELLGGGLSRGSLTEIVAGGGHSGSSTLLRALLEHAAGQNQIVTLIDGSDSFDATQVDENSLSHLLWIRCRAVNDAVKAADLVLRDGNLSFVLLDLKFNPEKQLRKIPATTWYRFQRLVEDSGVVCLVLTPRPMVARAEVKLNLQTPFDFAVLERDAKAVLAGLKLEVAANVSL